MVFTIFVLFDLQGKNNVKDDPKYLTAYNKLYETKDKEYIPLSPSKYKVKTYGLKALTLSINSVLLAFVVMEMVFTYNYMLLISYLISMIMAVIGGVMQMKKAEIYWTEEFPLWVDWKILNAELKEKIKENNMDRG